MSDREMPERGSLPGPGGNRFDAVDRLRKKLEGMKAAGSPEPEDAASKLTRLPRRPRRTTEEASERPHKTWRSEGGAVYDSPPTRPALRSELERETGWWPADPTPARHPAPEGDPGSAEHDASVIDLAASRRKRAGEDAAPGNRRMARPRRIGPSAAEQSDGDQNGDPNSPGPDGPARRH